MWNQRPDPGNTAQEKPPWGTGAYQDLVADGVRHKQPTSVGVALKERPTALQLCSFLGLFTGATQKKEISLKPSHQLEIMMTIFKKQQKFDCT